MRFHARFSFLAFALAAIIAAAVAAPAAEASFGVEKWYAANCNEAFPKCGSEEVELAPGLVYSFPKEPETVEEAEEQGYTQAGGRVPFGVTDFKVNTEGAFPNEAPSGGVLEHIRTDVAPGLATSPAAVEQCTAKEFGTEEVVPGTGFYTEPECEGETEIGVNKVTVYAGENGVAPGVSDLPLEGKVYNLVQKEGLASEFGVALELPKGLTELILFGIFGGTQPTIEEGQYFGHTLIEGNVEWGQEAKGTHQGDYHDYFEINVATALPLLTSRLVFFGRNGEGDFITNATSCPGHNTTRLSLTDSAKATAPPRSYTTLVGLTGCNSKEIVPEEVVPFKPGFSLVPGSTQSDQPDGLTTEVSIPHNPTKVDSSQLKSAVITLPEGMTFNESAAREVTEACTPKQARIESETKGVECPEKSALGTVAIEVPTLPPGSLKGKMYLGAPESGVITTPPYTMYLDAESSRYGISVRLKGSITANETTGQLTATFAEGPGQPPEQPFTKAILHFTTGALAPLANPLACGGAKTETVFAPFSGTEAQTPFSEFVVDSNNEGGTCPSSPPLATTQSTENQSSNAGGQTAFTFNLKRPGGDQYISQVKTTLPAGLVGAIPAVTQCPEPQASEGSCTSASEIGTATVEAGAGAAPFQFKGPVYLTGPYNGAPFGMSIAVPAVAGPFNLGTVVTRATIKVDPYSDRVTVTANLPRIVKAVGKPSSGILLRLQNISVAVNKSGFLYNPTGCEERFTETTVTGFIHPQSETTTGTQELKTPFQVKECGKLAFKPTFKVATGAKTSKAIGASLETTLNQTPGQGNVKSVLVQLPKQLPSRLTTLQKACPAATFEANPFSCPEGSFVGGARANTPLLPGKLTGPAILVSHAAAAFPDLDLVLEANGVRTILVGNTNIKGGITTSNFATTPDVPVSSITVTLPTGPHSALAANANLCTVPLVMPTTITAWSGATVKQNTRIAVKGCGVRIRGHRVIRNTAYLTIETPAAGRVSGSGRGLVSVYRHFRGAEKAVSLKIPLSGGGRRRHRPFRVKVRVGFVPKKPGPHSTAFITLTFR